MLTPYLPILASATTAVDPITTSAPSDLISFQTALLVIIAGTLVFLAKSLSGLNSRLTQIESDGENASGRTSGTTPVRHNAMPSGVVPPEVVAIISAAIHTTLKGRHRIISVGQICPNRQAWSAEGRRQVFSSHKVR
jgi:hypothetical protein